MVRNALAIPFIVALACSCASARTKPPVSRPAAPVVASSTPASTVEVAPALASEPWVESQKLEPGRCVESFDCVDTVGFPPAGHRWACENGKCGRVKLPDLNPQASSEAAEASADNSKTTPKAKKPKKRHN